MKTKINIYSPVDGCIKNLKELNDGVFSEGMLGDGFYIEPTSNEFYSPFKEGKLLQIFDTKHAYYFKGVNGPTILMHIGLETISLEGKPFKVFAQENDKLSLNNKIVEVNLKMLEKAKVAKSTVIILDAIESEGWSFDLFKKENVKKGEIIGEVIYKETINDTNYLSDINEILNAKNKHELVAEQIYNLIGSKNYSNVFNCMTRLRFEILDKKKVDEEGIKKLHIVKGVIWSKNQLQIIIGGEVYKVKDAFLTYVDNLTNENLVDNSQLKLQYHSVGKKIMMAFSAIILPNLPIMMASGLLMGIKTILVMTNVIQDMKIGAGGPINIDVDAFSVFINVAAETGLKLIGIFIGYNTIKWLGGPENIQLGISLMISGAIIGLGLVPQLKLFSIGSFDLKLSFYTSSIIPHIASAVILFYSDKWLKTWMPVSIDILFRPLLIILIVFTSIFFVLGPILFLIEQLIMILMSYLSQIPYGIGVAILCISWQPLVLTGMHVSIVMPLVIGIAQGIPSTLIAVLNIAVFAQVGASIGVALKTKNKITKVAIISALPGGIVGITEPILYGINLPKWRPFLAGIIVSGILGLFSGLLAVEARTSGGLGIFGFTGSLMEPLAKSQSNIFTGSSNSAILNCVLWFVLNIGVIPVSAIVCFFIYLDRIEEKKAITRTNQKVMKLLSFNNKESLKNIKGNYQTKFDEIKNILTDQELVKIKEIEKELIKITSDSVKLDQAEARQEKHLQKIIKEVRKLQFVKMDSVAKEKKQKNLIKKYDEIKNSKKIIDLNNLLNQSTLKNENNMDWLEILIDKKYQAISTIIDSIAKTNNLDYLHNAKDSYWNALNSLKISYEVIDAKTVNFSKKNLLKTTN